MPRLVSCPSCSSAGQMPDLPPGESVTCPVCRTSFAPTPPSASDTSWGVSIDAPTPVPTPDAAPLGSWLHTETTQFAEYVRAELARLAKARADTATAASRSEATRIAQAIELRRLTAESTARRERLDTRDADLGRREEAVAKREDAAAAREAKRRELEREATDLSRLVTDLRAAVERLAARRDELEQACAGYDDRHAALDRRSLDVGRAEVSLQRRAAELDEMEAALRAEFEARERDLERRQAVLEEEAAAVRGRES
jgi:DNA repair exonuclease SbcCD ATPase subunit